MTTHPLPIFVQRFFAERLANQLAASANTVASYRDTFRLLLTFATDCLGRQPTDLLVTDIDAELVGRFLDFVETSRGNSARSRNTRLAAIRSFFKYLRNQRAGAPASLSARACPAFEALPKAHDRLPRPRANRGASRRSRPVDLVRDDGTGPFCICACRPGSGSPS